MLAIVYQVAGKSFLDVKTDPYVAMGKEGGCCGLKGRKNCRVPANKRV